MTPSNAIQAPKLNEDLIKADPPHGFLIVGMGASAGGIKAFKAFKAFFRRVTPDSGCAYVVILHLSPDFESKLTEILQTVAPIPVSQVQDEKVKVEPDHVYVIPPNKSLKMRDGYLALSDIISYEERRAPVDIFFRTLAQSNEGRAVTVILSGTWPNDSMGVKHIKERGGIIMVQDPEEAQYSDMPLASLATGLVDFVLPVAEMPARIIHYRNHLQTLSLPDEDREGQTREELDEIALRNIFTSLRTKTGHDFSAYKRAAPHRPSHECARGRYAHELCRPHGLHS